MGAPGRPGQVLLSDNAPDIIRLAALLRSSLIILVDVPSAGVCRVVPLGRSWTSRAGHHAPPKASHRARYTCPVLLCEG
ncbi:hypothetical protein [Micromonospora deserti]|uniref:Uncharacterized protein n=1 Tax=Micromonospora deserti TaxID=2070366 RepID=A0A2W2BV75_9ACTN|nr:hypothetical protein [Micromonospora deserti]PZF84294.1 hypothetical protein C1I99_30490 [Micromonospora deserti]